MRDYSCHTISFMINAFEKKSANFPFRIEFFLKADTCSIKKNNVSFMDWEDFTLHQAARKKCAQVYGNSYTPEGTFLPRKEGSFRGRKIFVRKEAFK